MKYEKSFVVYIDFLGFSEASKELDDQARNDVLALLVRIAELRSEFKADVLNEDQKTTGYSILPEVSTFSDHIVISYPLESVAAKINDDTAPIFINLQVQEFIATIASDALRLGFLIRGAAAVGNLHHANGVVFGEGLVEVVELERRTSVYPRVVLSPSVTREFKKQNLPFAKMDDDGIFCIDYLTDLPSHACPPGDHWAVNVKQWFAEVSSVIATKLVELSRAEKLNEFSKWTWFAKRFRTALSELPPEFLKTTGIDLERVSWGK